MIDVDFLIKTAEKAGDEILDIYNSDDFEVEIKTDAITGDKSPLTRADKASHSLITQALSSKYPMIAIVSEEQDMSANLQAMNSGQAWVIDPIDGTKGFIKKNGEFTINIGLVENGIPTLGVVYAAVQNLMYYTDDNKALVDRGSGPETISASLSEKVIRAVASKNHMDETTTKFLEQFGDVELVQAGSSLKLCKVASGEAEIYPRLAPTTMEWDTAAADAILRAAGAKMVDMNGLTLTYNKPDLRNQGFIAHAPNLKFKI